MDLSSKKSRADLAAYFKKNNIPTEANFKSFIDSTLISKNDGIVKPPGDPISIEASTQPYKPALNLYEAFTDANPSWTISLASMSAGRGFTIGNIQDNHSGINARIFIELATGNIGIGTVMPTSKLDVAGQITASGGLDLRSAERTNANDHPTGRPLYVTGAITNTNGMEFRTSDATQGIGFGPTTIYAAGSNPTQNLVLAPKGPNATTAPGIVVVQSAAVIQNGLQVDSIKPQSTDTNANLTLEAKGSTGAVRVTSPLAATSTLEVTNRLTANGAVDAKSTVEVTGKLTANGAVDAKSMVDIKGKLTATGGFDLRSADRTNPNDHPTGRPLYVTGAITNTNGIEFRTSDASQGIGFGPTTIYAAGTNATQNLVLAPKGTDTASRVVEVQNGTLLAQAVKIGASNTAATSIVETITSSTAATALPTTSAVRSYVTSLIPGFATDLAAAPNTDLATVSAVKNFVNRAMPLGAIMMWSGSTIPAGWALCDGNDGRPNLADKFVLGRGTRAVGATGGEEKVTLGINDLPAHSHGASTGEAGHHGHWTHTRTHTGNISSYGNGNESFLVHDSGATSVGTTSGAGHSHSVAVNNTGGGQSHNNMPPYYVLAYIMRVS